MLRRLLKSRVSTSASIGLCAAIVMAGLVSSASTAAAQPSVPGTSDRLVGGGPAPTVRILVHYKPSTSAETYAQVENGLEAHLVGTVRDIHVRVLTVPSAVVDHNGTGAASTISTSLPS